MAQRGAMVIISELDVSDAGSNPNECSNSSASNPSILCNVNARSFLQNRQFPLSLPHNSRPLPRANNPSIV